jgi:hypothetical protein
LVRRRPVAALIAYAKAPTTTASTTPAVSPAALSSTSLRWLSAMAAMTPACPTVSDARISAGRRPDRQASRVTCESRRAHSLIGKPPPGW